MEQTNLLVEKIKEYASWCEKAQKAADLSEVDKAKVEGIKVLNRIAFQLSKAGKEIYDITRRRRVEITNETHAAIHNVHVEAPAPKLANEVVPPTEPAKESKTVTKKTKKSKK